MRVNPDFYPDLLNSLWSDQNQIQTYTEELATGKSVNMPSDNPSAAAADVENQAEQSETDQYLQNTSTLDSMLQTADSTLSSVVTSLNQAISLGTEASNGTLSSSDLAAIAQQVQGIQTDIVNLANTSFSGTYLFSGTATGTVPFTLDPTQTDGVQYNGNTDVNNVQIGENRTIQSSLPGSQIFLGSSGNVMGSIQQLVTALQSGNTDSISTATSQVSDALNYLSQQRVFYGNTLNQLNSNQTFLQQEQVNLQSQENTLVGANTAQAATELSQAETTYNAALAAIAQVIPDSLLNYLK